MLAQQERRNPGPDGEPLLVQDSHELFSEGPRMVSVGFTNDHLSAIAFRDGKPVVAVWMLDGPCPRCEYGIRIFDKDNIKFVRDVVFTIGCVLKTVQGLEPHQSDTENTMTVRDLQTIAIYLKGALHF